jgi:hypothetical protein
MNYKDNIIWAKRNNIILIASVILLAIVTVYCAWYSNYYNSGNSDDLVYPYLFQHFKLNDVILPSQHSNILKIPIYLLQAFLPYTFTTFSFVNIFLVLVTCLSFLAILAWVFGRRYIPIICIVLSTVLLGSEVLNYDLLGTTARNIEYPIMLCFVICVGKLLETTTNNKRAIIGILCVGLLYMITLSGDSFFLYTLLTSIIIALLVFWHKTNTNYRFSKKYISGFIYIGAFTILAIFLRAILGVIGIFKYYTDPVFIPHILSVNNLSPTLTSAFTQVLNLFGANIFGKNISPYSTLTFINLSVLIVGIIGLCLIIYDVSVSTKKIPVIPHYDVAKLFTIFVASLTFFTTFIIFVLSDLSSERYLTIMPFIVMLGFVYLVRRNFSKDMLFMVWLPIAIFLIIVCIVPTILDNHRYNGVNRDGPIEVAKISKQLGINNIITGYWYGATTRFWSNNQINYASVAGCNLPSPLINTRISWYKPLNIRMKSALVVTHAGPDESYWVCSNSQIISIYGEPLQIININSQDRPELWIYDYDLRSKIEPFIIK